MNKFDAIFKDFCLENNLTVSSADLDKLKKNPNAAPPNNVSNALNAIGKDMGDGITIDDIIGKMDKMSSQDQEALHNELVKRGYQKVTPEQQKQQATQNTGTEQYVNSGSHQKGQSAPNSSTPPPVRNTGTADYLKDKF